MYSAIVISQFEAGHSKTFHPDTQHASKGVHIPIAFLSVGDFFIMEANANAR